MTIEPGTEKMIKILFFIPGISEGGAEKVLRNLVNNMDQSKFDITVQTIDEYNPEQYLTKGIHYKAINRCRTGLGKKIFSYCFRLCAELKLAYRLFVKDDYDIEVAYLETAATKIIAQSTNKKAVKLAWVHCDLSKKEGMSRSAEKVKKQYSKYDKIICVSRDVEIGFRKIFGNSFDTAVLPNVIDEKEIIRKAAEPLYDYEGLPGQMNLLAVGRLTKQKNFEYLIRTCSQLRDDGYLFHLNILGEGSERNNLEEQIRKLELKSYITLRGFIKNPYPWMKYADIIVCSSKYEGSSTVVQEALILGKAVVTTLCTGMQELLGNSEYGMIVDDSDRGLFNGLKLFMDNHDFIKRYEKVAEERGKLFAKETVVRQTEEYFKCLLI